MQPELNEEFIWDHLNIHVGLIILDNYVDIGFLKFKIVGYPHNLLRVGKQDVYLRYTIMQWTIDHCDILQSVKLKLTFKLTHL